MIKKHVIFLLTIAMIQKKSIANTYFESCPFQKTSVSTGLVSFKSATNGCMYDRNESKNKRCSSCLNSQ